MQTIFSNRIGRYELENPIFRVIGSEQGRIHRFWKGAGHHGWPMKKIVGFRRSKKAKITLEAISFWKNISISIFQFSPLLHKMEACQWNLINFSKFPNALIRKEKTFMQQSMTKEKLRKVGLCFITSYFKSPLIWKYLIICLFWKLICSPIFGFWYQDEARNIKRRNRERQIAKNGKLQYLFQK